jgi:hypothetical protein
MERGWIDTMQLLGLDVVLMTTIAMMVLDRLTRVAKPLVARLGLAWQTHARPATAARNTVAQPDASWPPAPWRTSH